MNIIGLLITDDLKPYRTQPNFEGAYLALAERFGATKLGFHLEVIDPKNFSAPYHWHEQDEELFLVLDGEAIVRCNGEFRKVGPGDLIFYPVGPDHAHNMYNHTDKPFRFLGLSNVSSEYDRCHYPDSNKVMTEDGIIQGGEKVGYFKDEEDPAQYWPAHVLRGEF